MRRIAHALGLDGNDRRGHDETECSRKGGSGKYTTIHDGTSGFRSHCETDRKQFAATQRKVTDCRKDIVFAVSLGSCIVIFENQRAN